MNVKTQKNAAVWAGCTSLAVAWVVLLLSEPASWQKLLGLGALVFASALNVFVLYGMTKRSKEKGLGDYPLTSWKE